MFVSRLALASRSRRAGVLTPALVGCLARRPLRVEVGMAVEVEGPFSSSASPMGRRSRTIVGRASMCSEPGGVVSRERRRVVRIEAARGAGVGTVEADVADHPRYSWVTETSVPSARTLRTDAANVRARYRSSARTRNVSPAGSKTRRERAAFQPIEPIAEDERRPAVAMEPEVDAAVGADLIEVVQIVRSARRREPDSRRAAEPRRNTSRHEVSRGNSSRARWPRRGGTSTPARRRAIDEEAEAVDGATLGSCATARPRA
jgi:hypothetical protein